MLPKYFSGNRRLALFGLVLLGLIQASLAIIIAFKMRELFSALNPAQQKVPFELIWIIAASSLGVIALRIIERALAEKTGNDYTMELRLQLFSHLSRISQDKLDNQQQGAINLRFIGDLNAIKNWVSLGIPRLIAASLLLPALMYLLYWLHPVMFGFAITVCFVSVMTMYILKNVLLPYHRNLRNQRGNIASYMNERVRFAPQLRISGQRSKTLRVLRRKSERLKSAAVKKSIVSNCFKAIPDISLAMITAGCFALAFYLNMGPADAAVILSILAIFSQPLKDVAGFWDRRNAFNVASRKCLEILNTRSISSGKKNTPKNMIEPDIETSRLVLKGLRYKSQTIAFGEKVLITGENGCGKSTYLRMIAGIIQPDRGIIRVGGSNVLKIPENMRSDLLFYQGTEIAIFKGSLKQTLELQCKKTIPESQLMEVIEMFDLVGMFKRIGGLTGKIQEGGRNLSAGERKKIALCRAWLSDSRLLILDEVDDALDKASSSLIYKLTNKPDSTVLLISHRELEQNAFNQVINLSNS